MDATLRETFRHALRRVAGGVCLVTASDDHGRWLGITATSVASVSMTPPSLLACINTSSMVFPPIETRQSFCVNVLAQHHEQHGARFSNPADFEARFKHGDWKVHRDLPYLADAQAAIFCEVARKVIHGSHAIFIGNVTDVIAPAGVRDPLIYFNQRYMSGHLGRRAEQEPVKAVGDGS